MKITVVVPCYNSMKYLEQCITSVLEQDYEDYDVWAYDNESTDGTYEYLLELEKKHPKLTVFQVPNIYPNGYGEAQEHVIENLASDYVTFVGSDDFIEPNYISNCMKILLHDPEKIKCIQSAINGVQNGRIINYQVHSYKNLDEFKEQCLNKSPVNTPTVVWHKSLVRLLRTHEAHDAAELSCIGGGDYDTYCYMADQGIFIYPVPVHMGYYYRWHQDQATWKVHKSKKDVDYDKIIQEYWKKKWTL
jgi:glycosyltransferase involved in cell wall biosynthesis|tara:strand:- start:331 stop:1071 length:741 start_codon:yes stop_codon:yes gene_type:complete